MSSIGTTYHCQKRKSLERFFPKKISIKNIFTLSLTMFSKKVYILGGAQTDFATNWKRNGGEIADLLKAGFEKATTNCKVAPRDIESAHIGNFVGELFCKQGHLGGIFASMHPDLEGIPTARHEAACASGSMAILAGMNQIQAGWFDLVCVSGIEMMRNVSGTEASDHLGAAAWVGKEATEAKYPWVYLFSEIADYYHERFGLQEEHLAEIAKINYANAKRNPNAQTRNWEQEARCFIADEEYNPTIEGRLRKSDCGRITDGCATIFLASENYAKEYAYRCQTPLAAIPYIKGWGHRTATMLLQDKFQKGKDSTYPFPHLHGAIQDAFKRAWFSDVRKIDVIETHDCFTISEYVALEHFGLAKPGEAWKVIENGTIAFDGKTPVNPSGGLIGAGHPVGATGVRMMLDAYKQLTNQANDYQIENAKNVATLNIGGSFTTVASFVVGV